MAWRQITRRGFIGAGLLALFGLGDWASGWADDVRKKRGPKITSSGNPVEVISEPPPPPPPPPPGTTVDPALPQFSGVRVTGGVPAGVQAYQNWLGHTVSYVELFVGTAAWAPIDNPTSTVDTIQANPQWNFTITIPPFPDGIGASYAGLLAGSYDAHHVSFANAFVNKGMTQPIIRLGHEMNGNWFDWSPAPGSEADYGAGYRRVVNIWRGQGLDPILNWNTSNGAGSSLTTYPDPQLMWPEQAGDALPYVDIVSQDIYDRYFSTTGVSTRFDSYKTRVRGLNWAVNWARTKGKQFSIDEWGLTTNQSGGQGDSTYFVSQMRAFLLTCEHLKYHIYFDRNPAERHKISPPEGTTDFPNAQTQYLADF